MEEENVSNKSMDESASSTGDRPPLRALESLDYAPRESLPGVPLFKVDNISKLSSLIFQI